MCHILNDYKTFQQTGRMPLEHYKRIQENMLSSRKTVAQINKESTVFQKALKVENVAVKILAVIGAALAHILSVGILAIIEWRSTIVKEPTLEEVKKEFTLQAEQAERKETLINAPDLKEALSKATFRNRYLTNHNAKNAARKEMFAEAAQGGLKFQERAKARAAKAAAKQGINFAKARVAKAAAKAAAKQGINFAKARQAAEACKGAEARKEAEARKAVANGPLGEMLKEIAHLKEEVAGTKSMYVMAAEAREAAATKMQAVWRGNVGRNIAFNVREDAREEAAATQMQAAWRGNVGRDIAYRAREARQAAAREAGENAEAREAAAETEAAKAREAATKVQAFGRGRLARKHVSAAKKEAADAVNAVRNKVIAACGAIGAAAMAYFVANMEMFAADGNEA